MNKPMKIELRRFTTNARLSEETTAFAADIWIDGKEVGTAKNDGHGGSTFVYITNPITRDAVEALGKSQMPPEFKCTGGAEWIVDQLVETELQRRHDVKQARRLAKIDEKEKAAYAARGFAAARLRHADTWRWFAYKPDSDPQIAAAVLAAKHKVAIDELVVL